MWIQERKDPTKQWLQMCYCIIKGDIYMVISEWDEEWMIPDITYEVLEMTAEEEVGSEETQPKEI
jgi:hypothetical protein